MCYFYMRNSNLPERDTLRFCNASILKDNYVYYAETKCNCKKLSSMWQQW